MNNIIFIVRRKDGSKVVDILIDGLNMLQIIKEFETSFAGDLAGEYTGLPPEIVFYPSKHFFGDPIDQLDCYEGKSVILGCECGVIECWPLLVKITMENNTVKWSEFEQPHRGPESAGGHWKYDNLGPFMFDKKQYELALKKAAK